MPDISFTIHKVRRTCRAYAQKIAVVWPTIRRRSLYDDQVVEDVRKLIRFWRTRTVALRDYGYTKLNQTGRLQFARNCPPDFVLTDKTKLRPCKIPGCPWCHARHVGQVFDTFASLLPSRGRNQDGIHLVEVSETLIMNKRDSGIYPGNHLGIWRNECKKTCKRLKPIAGYFNATLAPLSDDRRKQWKLQYRILVIVEGNWNAPKWLVNSRAKYQQYHVRSKRELIRPVSRICRYPTGFLQGDPKMAAVALNGRGGIRTYAFVGSFYGQKKHKKE